MGGCASKPKDLNAENSPAVIEAPATDAAAPTVAEVEAPAPDAKETQDAGVQDMQDGIEIKNEVEAEGETVPAAESKPTQEEAKAVVEEKNEAPQSEAN